MLRSLFASRRADRCAVRRSVRLNLESLEDRVVPSTTPTGIDVGIGVFDPSTATWYLHSQPNAGSADAGSFQFGAPGWIPVVGDWNGSGETGIGVVDPTTNTWYLRNELSAGAPDAGTFQFGAPGWVPITGDWTGSGHTGSGAVDLSTNTWYLRNEPTAGTPDAGQFQYGAPGWTPVTGDWTGQGHAGIGVVNPTTNTWYLRNEPTAGTADEGTFQYGAPGWTPVTGDWTGQGHAGIGVVDLSSETWYLRNEPTAGTPDAGQFAYGPAGALPVVGNFPASADPGTTTNTLVTLTLNPLNINLLGLQVQTNQIQVTVSAQPGQGELLGNLLVDASNLVNFQGVNSALNNVLNSVVSLVNSSSLAVSGVNTTTGSLTSAPTATTPVLDAYIAPVHLNLLGAVVDTSPIHLTITAQSGPGLVLGNIVTDLANLFNPPLAPLNLTTINNALQQLISEISTQIPNIAPASTTAPVSLGANQVVSLNLPPINLNLLGLVLQTSQIQVNVNSQTGNGELLGNVITDLLNTAGATQQNLTALSNDLNTILADVIGVLNASSLTLPANAVSTLSQSLQTLSVPTLINSTGTTASTPILNLAIASTNGTTPPVDVNLLGVVVTTSNIQAQLIAQTGDGQILGNLLYNVANLLNPGGSLALIPVLTSLGV